MENTYVHPHALRHGVAEDEILYAWKNFISKRHRDIPNTDQIIAVGFDRQGRFVQMVGIVKEDGVMIYHAMTPPTTSFLVEIGLVRK